MAEERNLKQLLVAHLDQLERLLEEERRCLLDMRHHDLLRLTGLKHALLETLGQLARRAAQTEPAAALLTPEVRARLEALRTRGQQNHQLARGALGILDSLSDRLGLGGGLRSYDQHGRRRPEALRASSLSTAV
jgi:hypothetical protein